MKEVGSAMCTATLFGAKMLMLSSTSDVYQKTTRKRPTVMLSMAIATWLKSVRIAASSSTRSHGRSSAEARERKKESRMRLASR